MIVLDLVNAEVTVLMLVAISVTTFVDVELTIGIDVAAMVIMGVNLVALVRFSSFGRTSTNRRCNRFADGEHKVPLVGKRCFVAVVRKDDQRPSAGPERVLRQWTRRHLICVVWSQFGVTAQRLIPIGIHDDVGGVVVLAALKCRDKCELLGRRYILEIGTAFVLEIDTVRVAWVFNFGVEVLQLC